MAEVAPSVGLALIVKDEQDTLPTLLGSIEGAFDQVVLVDTGSKDGTVQGFVAWADAEQARNPAFQWQVEHFDWISDFAAARNYADSFLRTDWKSWADADDVITNPKILRQLAATAPEELVAYIFNYNYAQDHLSGNCICQLKRERLVRNGHSVWHMRVHEAQVPDGPGTEVPADVCEWVHMKQEAKAGKRNLDILLKWVKDEPENPRVLAYCGTELAMRGKHKRAMPFFRRYLKLDPGWDEERAQVHRKLAMCLGALGRHNEAIKTAFQALEVMPSWPDSYLTLAESYYSIGQYAKAAEWGQEALRRGMPNTMLIVNPLDYSFSPRRAIAASAAMLNDWQAAVDIGREAVEIFPGDEAFNGSLMAWRRKLKVEHTADTFAMCAQQLISHDEQMKAKILLEQCVPHFAQEHGKIIGLRYMLRDRLHWLDDTKGFVDHYTTGGSKPEDFVADENVDKLNEILPRSQFLLAECLAQAGVEE